MNRNTKTEIVMLRMSLTDKTQLENNAKKKGKSVSEFIRSKTLKS